MILEPAPERKLIESGKERVEAALLQLETLAAAGSSETVKRAACRDLLEYEGKIGPGSALKGRKQEHKIDEKTINFFVTVLAEVVKVDGSISLEGGGLENSEGTGSDQPLLPLQGSSGV